MNSHLSTELAKERAVAIAAVREAAIACRSIQAKIGRDAMHKDDRSPVTVADFCSQALVCRALGDAFEADPIVGEEDAGPLRQGDHARFAEQVVAEVNSIVPADLDRVLAWIDRGGASNPGSRFWTLDPIDGTKGFLRAEQYAIALALVLDGRVALAVLACPNLPFTPGGSDLGALFCAEAGQGATIAPLFDPQGEARPIRVSTQTEAKHIKFAESVESGHSSHSDAAALAERLGIVHPPLRMDSQAKYGVVARGEAEIYLRLPTRADYQEKIWDHAAGVLVVEEAGGRVTDVSGRRLDFTKGRTLADNRGVVVSHGPWHDRLLGVLADLGIG